MFAAQSSAIACARVHTLLPCLGVFCIGLVMSGRSVFKHKAALSAFSIDTSVYIAAFAHARYDV
jgi:hypothetical protein